MQIREKGKTPFRDRGRCRAWHKAAAPLLLAALVAAGPSWTRCEEVPAAPCGPVHVIPLRIHGGRSARSAGDLRGIAGEINRIWFSQACLCFAAEIVAHDDPLETGLDVWFLPEVGRFNGYFSGPHTIRVRDFPALAPAQSPSPNAAARTAAHEIGHGLGLAHRQDSDENLMRSRTYGWLLDEDEVRQARKAAAALAPGSPGSKGCRPPAGE